LSAKTRTPLGTRARHTPGFCCCAHLSADDDEVDVDALVAKLDKVEVPA